MCELFEKLGIKWKLHRLIENAHSRKNDMLYVEGYVCDVSRHSSF